MENNNNYDFKKQQSKNRFRLSLLILGCSIAGLVVVSWAMLCCDKDNANTVFTA